MKKFLLYTIIPFLTVLLCQSCLNAQELPRLQFTDGLPQRDATKYTDEVPVPHEIGQIPVEDIDAAILKGVKFLLKSQNRDGSWGLPIHTKKLNIYAPDTAHSGYRSGTTALALESLLRVERLLQNAPKDTVSEELKALEPEISLTIDRCENWMFEFMPKLKRSSQDVLYNNWGHAYGMSTLRLMYERKFPGKTFTSQELKNRQERIREVVRYQIRMLESCECVKGGWCYYDFDNSAQHPSASTLCFLTATVLVGLDDARACEVEIPEKVVERALASLLRQRRPNGSYAYGEYTINVPHPINHSPASLGRSQACSLALGLWGDTKVTSQKNYTDWLNRLIARNGWLDIGRKKPVPHESWFSVAGYFYYYAHYYAARVLEQLEDREQQSFFANHLTAILIEKQEKDGSWWDYPLYDYHPYYGTGMALCVLVRCREYFPLPKCH